MKTVRDILADHPNGISRPGLIAWARLRIDPAMTDEQLASELAALGDEVIEREGFLYLRGAATAASQADATSPTAQGDAWRQAGAEGGRADLAPESTASRGAWGSATGERPPDGGAVWTPVDATTWVPGEPATGREGWAQPSGSGRSMRLIITLIAVAVGVGTFLVGLLGASSGPSSQPTDDGSGTVVAADRMAVGDCFDIPTEGEFAEVRLLDCSSPHGGEVFLVADYDGDPGGFPTTSLFDSWALATCDPAFSDYTGSAWEDQDELDWSWFSPTESGWQQGDREMVCWLYLAGGSEATRSYRGANP